MVYMPVDSEKKVTESGKPATEAAGVKFIRIENGKIIFEVGSGNYSFSATLN